MNHSFVPSTRRSFNSHLTWRYNSWQRPALLSWHDTSVILKIITSHSGFAAGDNSYCHYVYYYRKVAVCWPLRTVIIFITRLAFEIRDPYAIVVPQWMTDSLSIEDLDKYRIRNKAKYNSLGWNGCFLK